jgi:murein L,D-transpeptidase YafK
MMVHHKNMLAFGKAFVLRQRPVTRRSALRALAVVGGAGASFVATGPAFGQASFLLQARPARIPISATGQEAIGRTRGRLQFAFEEQGLGFGSPVYLRIIKDQRRLEVWVQRRGRAYVRLRAYRLCGTGAPLGPRRNDRDPQQPEGFYTISATSLRPHPVSYLGVDLGWPNAFDRSLGLRGRTSLLQAGCAAQPDFGLTDPDMEEVYTLIHSGLAGGQRQVPIHIFPFAMTGLAMLSRNNGPNGAFWRQLAPAWQAFERTKTPPQVQTTGRRYRVIEQSPP